MKMVDIRCPMCGKQNPAEAITCKYCQARLKPLNILSPDDSDNTLSSSTTKPDQPGSESFESDLPDWLTELRGDTRDQTAALTGNAGTGDLSWDEDATFATDSSTSDGEAPPDWLARIDSSSPSTEESLPPAQAFPDWLGQSQTTTDDEGELPDWLRETSSTSADKPAQSTDFGQSQSENATDPERDDADLPDWLVRIRTRQAEEARNQLFSSETEEMGSSDRIARAASISDRPPVATSGESLTAILSQDTLRSAYRVVGAENQYNPTAGRLSGLTPLSYAAGVLAVMNDEQVSANIITGHLGSEIALLTDASEHNHNLTIAGTDDLPGQSVLYATIQDPLIGEELYAGGAYLGSGLLYPACLRAQDVMRWILIAVMIFGAFVRLVVLW